VTGSIGWSLESKLSFMRIGIVNDTGLAREALRRVVHGDAHTGTLPLKMPIWHISLNSHDLRVTAD
jgi:hypothetical protein